jgi:phosphate:Na+ symporter
MIIEMMFTLIGGLGFFFLGMGLMSDGLKKVANERLKQFLHAVTKHRIYGVFIGMVATMLVQSSSVTTVFVVGFVNASLIGLRQAITLIMGANIGTTLTAWLVSAMAVFKITQYALPAVGIGFALKAFGKGRYKNLGLVVLGFGVLFIGLEYMKGAFAPFQGSAAVQNIFMTFAEQPLLGVLIGIIFTVLFQSSSATIAIVQVLALNGLISFEAALPIILGDNIGTTITAQLASIGTNLNARRAAMSHTIFNVFGVLYMLPLVYSGWYSVLVQWVVPGDLTLGNVMVHIAVAHSIFNVFNMLIFLPLVTALEKMSTWLVPKKGETIDYSTQYLEDHLLNSPELALEQVNNEVSYMLKVARKAVLNGVNSFLEQDLSKAAKASELESVTDNLQSQITQYLVQLSQKHLEPEQSELLPILIHHVNDLERIGDHSQNLSELTKRRVDERLVFSNKAVSEIKEMSDEIYRMFDLADKTFKTHDKMVALKLLEYEQNVDQFQDKLKLNHVQRLNEGACKMESGFVFMEIVYNLEKIGDRLANIAQAVLLEGGDEVKVPPKPETTSV